jgi:hypothetical protein
MLASTRELDGHVGRRVRVVTGERVRGQDLAERRQLPLEPSGSRPRLLRPPA